MATFYSQEKTNARSGNKIDVTDWGGRVRAVTASIDWATINAGTALASGDQVELFDLPAGARVLFGQVALTALASFTTAIGIASSTGKYSVSKVTTGNATGDGFLPFAGEGATFTPLTAAETVLLTLGSGGSPATGRCRVTMYYVLD